MNEIRNLVKGTKYYSCIIVDKNRVILFLFEKNCNNNRNTIKRIRLQ